MKKLAIGLGLESANNTDPIQVYTDAANATVLAENRGYRPITKWLDNRYFFVRDALAKGTIKLNKIDGKSNPADRLTKSLDKIKFNEFKVLIKLKHISSGDQDNKH